MRRAWLARGPRGLFCVAFPFISFAPVLPRSRRLWARASRRLSGVFARRGRTTAPSIQKRDFGVAVLSLRLAGPGLVGSLFEAVSSSAAVSGSFVYKRRGPLTGSMWATMTVNCINPGVPCEPEGVFTESICTNGRLVRGEPRRACIFLPLHSGE